MLGATAGAAAVFGLAGWSFYLSTSSPASPPAPVTIPAVPAAALPLPARPAPADDPLTMSARELRDELHAEPAFSARWGLGRYAGRMVTWSGTVVAAVLLDGRLKVELDDPDGVRITAWCADAPAPEAATSVTVRGRIVSASSEGFVVDHCQLR